MAATQQKTSTSLWKIGEVAKRSGVAVETLRFYESRALIVPTGRTHSGYRLYDESVFERLSFVKKSQAVGFTLDQVAWIIAEAREGRRPCHEVREMARERLKELDRKLADLRQYRRQLQQTVEAWDRVGEKDGMICGLIEGLDAGSAKAPSASPIGRRSKASRRRI